MRGYDWIHDGETVDDTIYRYTTFFAWAEVTAEHERWATPLTAEQLAELDELHDTLKMETNL